MADPKPPPKPTLLESNGQQFNGYYHGTTDTAGNLTYEKGRQRHLKGDLPKPAKGQEWTKYTNGKGQIYWRQTPASVGEGRRREEAKREAEEKAARRLREAEQAEAAKNPPQRTVRDHGGDAVMGDILKQRQKKVGEIIGGNATIKGPAGSSVEIFNAGVSTSVSGTSVGPVTLGPDGKPIAFEAGAVTSTEDGRLIAGKDYEIAKGVKIEAKGAVNVPNAVVGGAGKITEGVRNWLKERIPSLGQTRDGGG